MSVKKINISGNEYDIKDANAQAMISDEFDSGTSYTTGNYCIYENVLYKFTSDKSAGAWDSGKVTATNIDTELSSLNSSLGSWSRVISMYLESNKTYDVELPENKALILAVENTYGVGCLYFVQTALSSENRDATTYSLGGNPNYFKVESISGQAAKVKVTPGEASGTLKIYSF